MKKRVVNAPFTSNRIYPQNLNKNDNHLFSHEYSKTFKGDHYLILNKVTVVNEFILSLKYWNLLTKYMYFYKPTYSKIFKDIYKNLTRNSKSSKEISVGIWITDNKSSVYFHWLCDALTRYLILPEEYENVPVLLPEKYDIPWIIEFLDFMNIKYNIIKKGQRIKVNTLIVPSYTAPSGNFNKKVINELRKTLLQKAEVSEDTLKNNKKIWISMEKHRRPINNMPELKKTLIKYGFEEVIFEDLSLLNKIKLLNEAKIIAGSHSSGLTNMIFMQRNSKVLDIRDPEDNVKNAFFTLSSELNLKYYYMERDKRSDTDIIINPKKLEEVFKVMDI
jgi:capsular polysaccharide biosynthesis protein